MYAITHDGKAFGPAGLIRDTEGGELPPELAEAYNAEIERQELAHIATAPLRLFLYVKEGSPSLFHGSRITTWRGITVGPCQFGPQFSRHTPNTYSPQRVHHCRAVIAGYVYHGFYTPSAGDYVRLKRGKPLPAAGAVMETIAEQDNAHLCPTCDYPTDRHKAYCPDREEPGIYDATRGGWYKKGTLL